MLNALPTKRVIRRMGLSDDQDGIMRRYIEEEGNWHEHLKNSKRYIEQTILCYKPKNITVLGSGWLLDLPTEFLLEHCENIYLYDIRHPNPIKNKFKKEDRIKFLTMDITGGMMNYIYDNHKQNSWVEDELPQYLFEPKYETDRIISLNILNQLDILIIEFLRKNKFPDSEKILALRKHIQKMHLISLKKLPSTLITDYREMLYDRLDKKTDERSLIFNEFPDGKQIEEWIWKFDTQMTYYPNRKTYFKVRAQHII